MFRFDFKLLCNVKPPVGDYVLYYMFYMYFQGRIKDFFFFFFFFFFFLGGGCKKLCCAHHITSPKSLTAGSRARLRALEALGVCDARSCYLSLIFKHSDTNNKMGFLKCSQSKFRGGGGVCLLCPLLNPPQISFYFSLPF